MNYIIADFDIKLSMGKVHVSVWNNKNTYDLNFVRLFEDMLKFHGYDGLIDELKEMSAFDLDITMRYRHHLSNHEIFNVIDIDRYSFIQLEVI